MTVRQWNKFFLAIIIGLHIFGGVFILPDLTPYEAFIRWIAGVAIFGPILLLFYSFGRMIMTLYTPRAPATSKRKK